jgi:hypothetical protein
VTASEVQLWAGIVLGSGGFGFGLINLLKDVFVGGEGRRAENAAKRAEGANVAAQTAVSKHESWRADFERNYEILEERCDECTEELRKTRRVVNDLIDELEDQVLPMLMIPGTDPAAVRNVTRRALQRARNAL